MQSAINTKYLVITITLNARLASGRLAQQYKIWSSFFFLFFLFRPHPWDTRFQLSFHKNKMLTMLTLCSTFVGILFFKCDDFEFLVNFSFFLGNVFSVLMINFIQRKLNKLKMFFNSQPTKNKRFSWHFWTVEIIQNLEYQRMIEPWCYQVFRVQKETCDFLRKINF